MDSHIVTLSEEVALTIEKLIFAGVAKWDTSRVRQELSDDIACLLEYAITTAIQEAKWDFKDELAKRDMQ